MKKIIILSILMFLNFQTFASESGLTQELQILNLPESVLTENTGVDFTKIVLDKIRINPAPGLEGVEQTELPNSPAPQVYSTASIITKALEDSQLLPLGEKIQHFENAVKRIMRSSGNRKNELIARMTLNRAVDTLNTVLPIAGNNTDEVARFAANFYTEAFKLSLGFTTNQFYLQSTITFDQFYKNNLYIAEYGRMMATLLYRFSMNANISDSAKSVLLLKTLGYLGWDLKLDLRSREQAIREVLADIYTIQKEDRNVQNILNSIDNGFEPKTSDVNKVRGRVYKVLESLPQIIKSAYLE